MLSKNLQNLENQDIIEKVTERTPWVSPVEIRICIDMREANKAIERERHLTPTIDDLTHELNGAKKLFPPGSLCWVPEVSSFQTKRFRNNFKSSQVCT